MKFNIRGSKMKITPAINDYIEDKIGKLEKYLEYSEEVTATVVVRSRGKDKIVEVTMPIKKAILRGEENHEDLYAAIDLVSEKIERQILKNKTRMKKKVNYEVLRNFKTGKELVDAPIVDDDKEKIVKRKKLEMKPMDEEEAILQMNLLGHDFFVYHDFKLKTVCVVYKRKEGGYGLIVTG